MDNTKTGWTLTAIGVVAILLALLMASEARCANEIDGFYITHTKTIVCDDGNKWMTIYIPGSSADTATTFIRYRDGVAIDSMNIKVPSLGVSATPLWIADFDSVTIRTDQSSSLPIGIIRSTER